MRLRSIAIEGFRGFAEPIEIDLDADVVILHGPNGVGKTSLLDAILWVLTGRLDRFGDRGGPISLYSREGVARVQLELSSNCGSVTVLRSTNGDRETLRVRMLDQEFDGRSAEEKLIGLLVPHLAGQFDSNSALSSVLTRGVYLQQDLVRQFVDSDTPNERFSLISEVMGAGVVIQLQQTLEKSRLQWSRNSNSFRRDTLDPLQAKLKQIDDQLFRLNAEGIFGPGDIGGTTEQLYQQARYILGHERLTLSEAPTSSGGLDRLLRELGAERSRLERELSTIAAVLADAEVFGVSLEEIDEQIAAVTTRQEEIETAIAEADAEISRLLSEIAVQRDQLVSHAARTERLATLASLALEDLGDVCPVCQQSHDVERTISHLQALLSAVDSRPQVHAGDLEGKIELIQSERADNRAELERVRSGREELQSQREYYAQRQEVVKIRVNELGLSQDEVTLDVLQTRRTTAERSLEALTQLLRRGEQLSLSVVRLGEQRRRAEALSEREILSKQVNEAQRTVEEYDRTHALAGKIIDKLRDASLAVTRRQIEQLAPLFQRIYSRIDPHPTFRVTHILASMRGGKGQLKVGVADPTYSEDTHEPTPILSSSQLNSFAVSLFLALNLALPTMKLKITMLDDPLQSLDSINLLGLVDVLRRFRAHRQIIVSTHEARLLGLLQRKLRPVKSGERMITLTFEGWSRAGPTVKVVPVTHTGVREQVLAA